MLFVLWKRNPFRTTDTQVNNAQLKRDNDEPTTIVTSPAAAAANTTQSSVVIASFAIWLQQSTG